MRHHRDDPPSIEELVRYERKRLEMAEKVAELEAIDAAMKEEEQRIIASGGTIGSDTFSASAFLEGLEARHADEVQRQADADAKEYASESGQFEDYSDDTKDIHGKR
jgi:hypothetical protein